MSDFVMKPVPENKLDNLRGIFDRRYEELKDTRHLSTNSLLDVLKTAYSRRSMDCYTDDVDNPSCFVLLTPLFSLWDNDPQLMVTAVYVDVLFRGNAERLRSIVKLVESYAGVHGFSQITSWAPANTDGTPSSTLWEKAGFSVSGITYNKIL